jgi:hypothetical protein
MGSRDGAPGPPRLQGRQRGNTKNEHNNWQWHCPVVYVVVDIMSRLNKADQWHYIDKLSNRHSAESNLFLVEDDQVEHEEG